MSSTELKLTAVWTGTTPPPATLKLSDYTLPIEGEMPKGYFSALYGNRVAYAALGEILTDAQKKGLYYSTATVTVALKKERKPGVIHLQDIGESNGGLVNLTRVSKEVTAEIAAIYKQSMAHAGATTAGHNETETGMDQMDWRKPFRFMPERLELLPQVFDLLECDVLVHPVKLSVSMADTVHHVATLMLGEVEVVSAEPNRFEVGPHPDKILF